VKRGILGSGFTWACPDIPVIDILNLAVYTVGFINVSDSLLTYAELERLRDNVYVVGGVWRPRTCRSRDRVALVVPYRDRDSHLRAFLRHIHPFLQKQLIHYAIYVVEQVLLTYLLVPSPSPFFVYAE